jgi:hypothetical protein
LQADSEEKTKMNIAYGHLSGLLVNLCVVPELADIFRAHQAKHTLQPLRQAYLDFIAVLKVGHGGKSVFIGEMEQSLQELAEE